MKPSLTLVAMMGVLLSATTALAQEPERWLHVHIMSTGHKSETVRVNVPLSVAEQILPAIHAHGLQNGRVKIAGKISRDVDLQALLNAVRQSPDNEFLTIVSDKERVRVAKSGEYLLVTVAENKEHSQNVDIKIPIQVVDALLSNGQEELDVLAALRVLKSFGNIELVKVTDQNQNVRIWLDSRSTAD